MKTTLLVALPGSTALASALSGELDCEWTELGTHRFPDGETLVRIDADVAQRRVVFVGAPWTVMAKTRRGDREVSVVPRHKTPWPGCTPVLLDDIVSTAHTLAAAAQALQSGGWLAPICIAVHALVDGEGLARLYNAGAAKVVTCDTVPHPTNGIALAPALGDATRALAWQCANAMRGYRGTGT